MQTRFLLAHIIVLSALLVAGCGSQKKADEHTGNDHGATEVHAGEAPEAHEGEEPNAHAGEAPGAHEGEEPNAHAGEAPGAHAGEGQEIVLTQDAVTMAGIALEKAAIGTISASLDLSGEVGFNEDRLVHITPRFPGIAKESNCKVGDFVNAGAVVAVIESNESMTQYALKAPISGRIIEKHITPGEHVSETESVYMLADLSTVWVNLAVYPKDAATVKPGQTVTISSVGTEQTIEGTIAYVTPVMDPQTRRLTARTVLQNSNNEWRPGTFVNAHIEVGGGKEGLVVNKEAVQIVNGETVVFVQHEPNAFKPVDVSVGEQDSRNIRILGGLEAGAEYVSKGAFELKAKIVTSSLGGHAGHGH
jgi:cobalt-zinc-cadmium efflux system membrane fusion protein